MTIAAAEIERIREATDLVMLVGQTVALKKKGKEFWGLCPWHPEKTSSFKVDNERHIARCFGCGRTEDAFQWVQSTKGLTFPEAVAYLSNGAVPHTNGHAHAAPQPKRHKAEFITPVPAGVEPPSFAHPRHGKPTTVWAYRNAVGEVMNYVARYDPEGERKVFSPWSYTAGGWAMKGLPAPRTLFGLELLAANPQAEVVVTEGEKACLAARKLLPGHVCVTWHGGAQAMKQTDWTPLKGRTVLIWPDADEVGATAAKQIVKLLGSGRILVPPEGVESGFDAADATAEQAMEMLAEPEPIETRGPMPEPTGLPAEDPADAEPEVQAPEPGAWPFNLLGHRNGSYAYLPHSGGTVITLGGAAHTKRSLMMLAPLQFWETAFGARNSSSFDIAGNALIQAQHRHGIYDPTRMRGRGCWIDKGKVVIHLGDRLIVDGVVTAIREFKSEFLYEIGPRMRYVDCDPLDSPDARKLIDLCKMFSWERPLSAYLLAGWCALAPFGGALAWRPHIFLSGAASSGKTHIYQQVICKIIGNMGLALAASITEPGVRRALGSDSLPIMVDEMEPRGPGDIARIESIMGLMRYSSSETDAMIVKGSQGAGGVEWFRIRSMFCTVAIGSIISDYADSTRTSTLALKAVAGVRGQEMFNAIQLAERDLLTENWIDRLRARIVSLLPTIRRNAETFAVAGAKVLGTRRLGDQMGALLAGAYALNSTAAISASAAEEWLNEQDWSQEQDIIVDTDGPLCLARIMEHQVMVEARLGGAVRRSLAELCALSIGGVASDAAVSCDTATATLRRHGLMPMEVEGAWYIAVSNTHSEIAGILDGSPWPKNWKDRLKTLPGARSADKSIGFASKQVQRAMLVPWIAD